MGRRRRLIEGSAFAVVALAAAGAILWYGRTWQFFYDDWGTILYRRAGGLSAFLAPHNGHLQAVGVAVYRALFETVGLDHYGAYQLVGVVFHVACALLLFVYARRRVGPWLALVLTTPFLFLASAWEVLFWPYEIGFVVPVAAFIGVLALNDAGHRLRHLGTGTLLLVALASSGIGVAVTVGAAVDAVLSPERRRRLAAVAAPALLYVAWFALYRPGANTPAALRHVPGAHAHGDVGTLVALARDVGRLADWVLDSAKLSAGALVSTRRHAALAAALVFAALVVVLWRRRSANRRVLALCAALAAEWLLTGLTRSSLAPAPESRYLYPAAALLLLVVAEALRGWRAPRLAPAIAALAVAAVVAHDRSLMADFEGFGRTAFAREDAALAVVERCPGLPPSFAPDRGLMPDVTAGPYLAAVRDLGSPLSGAQPPPRCP